jgi:transposase
MAGPISEDLRHRIVATWRKGQLTTEQLAERFSVGTATVKRLTRLYRETKSVAPRPHGGGQPRKIKPEQEALVEALVQAHPDWSEDQYAKHLTEAEGIRASAVTVGRVIRRLGYSVKKRPSLPKSATGRTSSSDGAATSNESKASPFRVWFLWTRPAPTSR